ncbi:hypothetical protein K435DRAFT_797179 [Dendrothele bispora CBS 962.96]|uniref:Extracellular membrane protein CFEM domain-containing protein n=1 Tax=Dendrothele bispora (strain CBS 962.96) TaxID=1314807 RepID=A0A4S8M4K3_DENBC|nr:hypothetical protein K435DRAFT_797179 [Dendrothele bispora CBS 962.96]
MQLSNVSKILLIASAYLIPSIATRPAPLDALVKKEDCCDPNFFFPCLAIENFSCSPDDINLCSFQAEQDCRTQAGIETVVDIQNESPMILVVLALNETIRISIGKTQGIAFLYQE